MNKRYIDAEALKQTFCAECSDTTRCDDCDIDYHFEHLAPTADVVERKTAILNPTEVITWFEDINGHRNIVFKLPFAVTDVNTISIRLDGCNLQEVKRGEWKIKTINTFEMAYGTTGYEPVYECSLCGMVEESYLRLDEPIMPEDADFPSYCPNCGASMRKEVKS